MSAFSEKMRQAAVLERGVNAAAELATAMLRFSRVWKELNELSKEDPKFDPTVLYPFEHLPEDMEAYTRMYSLILQTSAKKFLDNGSSTGV